MTVPSQGPLSVGDPALRDPAGTSNRAQIEILMDSVKAGMVQMDDSTLTDAQRSAILSGLSGYRSTIGTLTAWNNSALQLAGTTKVLTAESIKAANTNIGTTKAKEQPQARMVHAHDEMPPAPSSYTIMPNPARGWAAFNYDRKEIMPENGSIIVREITGRVVATLPMQGPIGQQVWDTRSVAAGAYMVEFRVGEHLLHPEKLIVGQ